MAPLPHDRKFTKARREIILEARQRGLYKSDCAALAGIDRKTLWRWIERGQQDLEDGKRTTYAKFVEALERAEAQFKDDALAVIRQAARVEPKAWAGMMTILERSFPDQYGRRDTLNIEGDLGQRSVTVNIIGDAKARELANQLLAEIAEPGPVLELEAVEVEDAND